MSMDTKIPIIRLKDICFAYPGRPFVLKGINFELYNGERIGLLGANGSGKTTLLHIIMGLIKPYSGEIEIFGKQRKKDKDFQEVRERIGLLFQDPDDQLFSPTVAADVAFGPLNLGKTNEEAIAIVHEILALLGIPGFEDRITYRLSGGEKRIVSLAAVLAMQPETLLLDEPTAGLDEKTKKIFINFLKTSALSYLIVSHDRDFLLKTTNTLYQINNGILRRVKVSREIEDSLRSRNKLPLPINCL